MCGDNSLGSSVAMWHWLPPGHALTCGFIIPGRFVASEQLPCDVILFEGTE